jgi:hypothetical protein
MMGHVETWGQTGRSSMKPLKLPVTPRQLRLYTGSTCGLAICVSEADIGVDKSSDSRGADARES